MKPNFRVTYDIVTEESARDGDVAERGFVLPGGEHVAVDDDGPVEMTLRAALNLCHPQEDAGSWFCEVDGRPNYQTGDEETRSLHPPDNITAASYGRLKRLLSL